MRRWLARILLLLILLAALLVAVVQGVLWSDLPRRIVVDQLEQQTGLSVRLDAVRVGWLGGTTLENLRLAPPLAAQPVLEAPHVEAGHTMLPALLVGRPFAVRHLTLDRPTLHLRRHDAGQWNVQRVLETVFAARPPGDPEPGPLDLPALTVRDATVHITRSDRPAYALHHVGLTGRPGTAVDYLLRLDAGAAGTLQARFSRAAPHPHTLRFDLHPSEPLFAALGIEPRAYRAQGQWEGRLDHGALRGELELTHLDLPELAHVTGRLTLRRRADNGAIELQPQTLRIEPRVGPAETVTFDAGRLVWNAGQLTAHNLHLLTLDGEVQLTGSVDPAARTGELSAAWRGLTLPDALTHTGEFDLTLERAGPARRRAHATVRADVDSPLGQWRSQVELTAVGRSWKNLETTATVRQVRLTRAGRTFTFPDLSGEMTVAAPTITLNALHLLDAPTQRRLAGEGVFDWRARTWSATLEAEQLPLAVLPEPFAELTQLRLDVSGQGGMVQLREARFSAGDVVATAEGRYQPEVDAPLQLDVELQEAPIRFGGYDDTAHRAGIEADNLAGGLRVAGTLRPLSLRIEGKLTAETLQVYHEQVGDLALTVHAAVDTESLRARADAVEWLGGQWELRLEQVFGQTPRLLLEGRDVDLSLVDRLLGRGLDLQGAADVSVVTSPSPRRAGAPLTGSFELRNVARGALRAERIAGSLRLAAGTLRIHNIEARQGDGRLTGEIALPLDQPSRIRFDQRIENWPVLPLARHYQVRLSGAAHGTFDAAQLTGDAEAQLRAVASFQSADATPRQLATLSTDWRLAESTLDLHRLDGELLDGPVTGQGQVDLRALRRAELDVRWEDVAPAQLAPVAEPLTEAAGTLAGSIHLAPTDERRAVGPLRVDLRIDRTDATYRDLPLGAGHATAFLDPDRRRYVLHEMRLETVGGVADLWGRVTWQPDSSPDADGATDGQGRSGNWHLFVQGALENIDLAMLTRALRGEEEEPIIGRIDASATVTTPLREWSHAFGQGRLAMRESDIANVPLISILYDLVNVNWFAREPAGQGEARFRVEDGAVVFDRFHYTNRGTQIDLAMRIANLWQGPESAVDGYALVSATPLPDIELLEMINRAVSELQAGVTTARIGGTLGDPVAQPMLFQALQSEIGRLLIGAQYEEPAVNRLEQPPGEQDAPSP